MEAWYTDKKKGICHGDVTDCRTDYCGRRYFLVGKKWIQEDRLFQSKEELQKHLDDYVNTVHWDRYDELAAVSIGYCVFRSTMEREWLKL